MPRINHSEARSEEAIRFAREQRLNANDFAKKVWSWVRNRKCRGLKFRREYPIPPYTVDFCCVEAKLIIEVDGALHFTDEGREYDRARDRFLSKCGYRIIRVEGFEVLRNELATLARIEQFIDTHVESEGPKESEDF